MPGSGLVLRGSREEEVFRFEAAVVDFFVDAAGLLGVPKSVAAIYGVIFASPQPLSFAEVEARLDISKGSVSQGLRVLQEIGALKEVSEDADRTNLFTPDLEMRKLVARFLENRLKTQLDSGSKRLATLQQTLPARRSTDTDLLRKRLSSLQDWHSKARALLPIAKTFLKLGG